MAGALELHVLGVVEDGAEDVGEDGGGPRAGGDRDRVPVSAEHNELPQYRLSAAQHDPGLQRASHQQARAPGQTTTVRTDGGKIFQIM